MKVRSTAKLLTASAFTAMTATLVLGQSDNSVDFDGGTQLTFGATTRFEVDTNSGLNPVSQGTTQGISTGLSLNYLTGTPFSRFSFDLGGRLRLLDEQDDLQLGTDFVNPTAKLKYNLTSASSRFEAGASLSETQLIDLEDPSGLATLSGTQRKATLATALNWRDDAPMGFGVSLRHDDVTFAGEAGALQSDYQRFTYEASSRFDINEVTQLNVKLSHSVYDGDRAATIDTTNLTSTLDIERPFGTATGSVSLTDTEGGNRVTVSAGHSFDMPRGTQSFNLGVTRGTTQDLFVVGDIDLKYELPRGQVQAQLSRSVGNNALDDAEQILTRVSLGYLQELTAVTRVRTDFGWSESDNTATSEFSRYALHTLAVDHELNKDWMISVGYRKRIREQAGIDDAEADILFVDIKRAFSMQF